MEREGGIKGGLGQRISQANIELGGFVLGDQADRRGTAQNKQRKLRRKVS